MARLYVLTGCRSVLNPTCIYSSILAMFFSGVRFVSMNIWFYINLLSTPPPPPIFLKTKDLKHCSQTLAGECLKLKEKRFGCISLSEELDVHKTKQKRGRNRTTTSLVLDSSMQRGRLEFRLNQRIWLRLSSVFESRRISFLKIFLVILYPLSSNGCSGESAQMHRLTQPSLFGYTENGCRWRPKLRPPATLDPPAKSFLRGFCAYAV